MGIPQPDLPPGVYRCPGEPYTIPEFICRARQEKHYEKCPTCPIFQEKKVVPMPFRPSFRYEQRTDARFVDPGRAVRCR